MRGSALMVGSLLGGALVAACLYDPFRDQCRRAIIGVGKELSKELSGLLQGVKSQVAQTTQKENDHDGNERKHALPVA